MKVTEVGNGARTPAANHRELAAAGTAEPGTEPSPGPRVTGTLPAADWRVKQMLKLWLTPSPAALC
jgi:hypothetical protein